MIENFLNGVILVEKKIEKNSAEDKNSSGKLKNANLIQAVREIEQLEKRLNIFNANKN